VYIDIKAMLDKPEHWRKVNSVLGHLGGAWTRSIDFAASTFLWAIEWLPEIILALSMRILENLYNKS
jgi:hypothetical protein